MNIQSNINQTLSIAGLLLSQTSLAEKQRVKAREPEREAELKQLEAKKDIKLAEAKEKQEIRKTAEINRAQEKQKLNIDTLTGIHTTQAGAITALPRTEKKNQLSAAAKDIETYEKHLLARKAAIESGEKLYKVAPTTELAENISTWQKEVAEIKDFQKAQNEKAKKDELASTEAKAASRAEKMAQKAQKAAEEEQARQFRSKFLEGIYSPLTDPRKEAK